ncbi:transketolase, partial [Streptococcus suis]
MKRFAKEIRYHKLATLNQLGFCHYGGSLSIVEVFAALYGEILEIRVQNFYSKERDQFILSKGHEGPALYSKL